MRRARANTRRFARLPVWGGSIEGGAPSGVGFGGPVECEKLIQTCTEAKVHERTDEANFQGEFNGIGSRREQTKQCPGFF